MAPSSDADPPDAPLGGLILRAVALLVILDLWAVHHFAFGIGNIVVPAGIAAALGGAIKVAGFVWDEATVRERLQDLVKPVRPFLSRLVTRGTVTWLAVLVLVLMVSVSSVTVVDAAGEGASVAVASLERPDAARQKSVGSGATIRFPVLTTPFGRLVRVDATGYVGAAFTVYPPIGLRLQLGRDLPGLPSVLFRPGPEALSFLADGAVFRVLRIARDGTEGVLAADSGHVGSFLLGRPRPVSSGMIEDWTRGLEAAGTPPAAVAGIVSVWKAPARLATTATLAPGDILRAEVLANGTVVAATETALDGVELIDVAVEPTR